MNEAREYFTDVLTEARNTGGKYGLATLDVGGNELQVWSGAGMLSPDLIAIFDTREKEWMVFDPKNSAGSRTAMALSALFKMIGRMGGDSAKALSMLPDKLDMDRM